MSVVEFEFETGAAEPSSSFFVNEPGWPVVGPFASRESAGRTLAWIQAILAGPSSRGAPPEPSPHDTARFRDLWESAAAGGGLVRLWTWHVDGRRWVRSDPICHNVADSGPDWRSGVEVAISRALPATGRDEAGPDLEGEDVGPPTGPR